MKLSDKAQKSIQRVIDAFQNGDLSPITTVARLELDDMAPASKWSFSNKVLAFIQSGELDCRGFQQWKDAGRTVKKGSEAVYILRPRLVKVTPDDKDEGKEFHCIGFLPIPVFSASNTEGEGKLPSYAPAELPPLFDVAQRLGITAEYVPVAPARLGDNRPDGSKIRIGSHDTSVFFHELAHAIHAKISGGLKGGQDQQQETVAEFTAAVLMDFYAMNNHTGNAWRYIKEYANDPLVAITKALGIVENILAVLLEQEPLKKAA